MESELTTTMTRPARRTSRPDRLPFSLVLLAMICTLDTVSTMILVSRGLAIEANPILAWTFRHGNFAFLAVKMLSFVPAIVYLESIRARKPGLVKGATWFAVAGYLAIYVFGTLHLHL